MYYTIYDNRTTDVLLYTNGNRNERKVRKWRSFTLLKGRIQEKGIF